MYEVRGSRFARVAHVVASHASLADRLSAINSNAAILPSLSHDGAPKVPLRRDTVTLTELPRFSSLQQSLLTSPKVTCKICNILDKDWKTNHSKLQQTAPIVLIDQQAISQWAVC